MKGVKGVLKKHKIDDSYYVRISPNSLDLDNEAVAEAIKSSGDLSKTWTLSTLRDLDHFLTDLYNNLVRPASSELPIGAITYLQKGRHNKGEETGLDWQPAILTIDYQNFVVSTLSSMFNDRATRQDEEIGYEDMIDAAQRLIENALAFSDLKEQDMPTLPTVAEYMEALNNDDDLTITAKRFDSQQHRLSTQEAVDQAFSESSEPVDEQSPERGDSDETKQGNQPNVTEQTQEEVREQPVPVETTPVNESIDPIELALDNLQTNVPLFELSGNQLAVEAQSDQYVAYRENEAKRNANIFLASNSRELASAARSNVLKLVKDSKHQITDRLQEIMDRDWQTPLKAEFAKQSETTLKEELTEQQKERREQYDRDVDTENSRHEQALVELKSNYGTDLQALRTSITETVRQRFAQQEKEALESYSSAIIAQIRALQDNANQELLTQVEDKVNQFVIQNTKTIQQMRTQLDENMVKRRSTWLAEHNKALVAEAQRTSAQAKAQDVDVLQRQVDQLQATNDDLRQKHQKSIADNITQVSKLETQLDSTQQQLADWQENAKLLATHTSTAAVETAPPASEPRIEQLEAQVNDFKTRLERQQKLNQQRAHNPWKTALLSTVGLLALLGIGGGSFVAGQTIRGKHQETKTKPTTQKPLAEQSSVRLQHSSVSSANQDKDSADSSSAPAATSTSRLDDKYHVGDQIQVSINGMTQTVPITDVKNDGVNVDFNHQTYFVQIP